jgi:glycosyltransferase involved in cell wall biosynthesis
MFRIVTTGYRCADYLDNCIKSVVNQDGIDLSEISMHVAIDGEPSVYKRTLSVQNVTINGYYGRTGSPYRTIHLISGYLKEWADNDIICLLDADDALLPNALATVKSCYRIFPSTRLTYGSYRNVSGKPAKWNGEYKQHEQVRKAKWHASHLKTFTVGLFKHFQPKFILDADNNWLMAATDMATMFPLMEIAGMPRCRHITTEIYLYNDSSPKVSRQLQKDTEKWLRKQKPVRRVYGI